LVKLYEFSEKKENSHSYIIYLKEKPLDFLPKETSWWKYEIVKPQKMWTQIAFPLHLLITLKKPDVLLSLTHYAPRFTTIPTIVSVMDVSYLNFPDTFKKRDLLKLTKWTEYSVKRAKKIITISKSSKNDIIKHYKVPEEKTKVVYLGLKKLNMDSSQKDLASFGVHKKFILFVGTLQPRKNISRLIEAFSLLPQKLKAEYQLVVIGKKGWLYEEILKAPEKFRVSNDVLFLDYVKDNDLPEFYKKAQVFVLPSLYEGFGLPVLEAMRYGCPVAVSNVSSLPEAGGEAALYFDPESTTDIKNTIEKILTDSKLREKMREKGREQFKKFTWEKAAKEVLEVVESLKS
jgi:glycosyltransferase involved in cell wall biosynthesis